MKLAQKLAVFYVNTVWRAIDKIAERRFGAFDIEEEEETD